MTYTEATKATNGAADALARHKPDCLSEAWAEAEAALPWDSGERRAWQEVAERERDYLVYGPTPAAALRALAERLRAAHLRQSTGEER